MDYRPFEDTMDPRMYNAVVPFHRPDPRPKWIQIFKTLGFAVLLVAFCVLIVLSAT